MARVGGAHDEVPGAAAAWAASSSAMSRARQTVDVSGIRCCLVACWADVMRSHSSARACARYGLESGTETIFLVPGCRRGRVSRWIW